MGPAAVAVGGGAVAAGVAAAGAAAVVKNINRDVVVSNNLSFFDRLAFAFPQLRLARFLVDAFDTGMSVTSSVVNTSVKDVDVSSTDVVVNSVAKTVEVANKNIDTLKTSTSDLLSSSDYTYQGEPLVDIFVRNAQILDKRLAMIADVLVKQSVSNTSSIVASLSALNTSVSSLNSAMLQVASAVSSVAGYFDVQNILTSEIYGVLYSLQDALNKVSESIGSSTAVISNEGNKDVSVNIDLSLVAEKLSAISSEITKLKTATDKAAVVDAINSLKDAVSALDLSVTNQNNVDVDLSSLESVSTAIRDVFSKTKQKDEAVIDDINFKREVLEVKDLDGNVVARITPRELSAVKDAVKARAVTDEINFELDDDDLDIVGGFDLSLLPYEKLSDIVKAVRDNNGS